MIMKRKFTTGKVIERYSNAINDLAEVQRAINIKDEAARLKHMSDAGEALSQTIEWALHCCIEAHDSHALSDNYECTPKMINSFFLSGTEEKSLYSETLTGEKTTVNFDFLKSEKAKVTNNRKHRAGDLDFEKQKTYAIEIAKFIHEYLDDTTHLLTLDEMLAPEHDKMLEFYIACNSFSHQDCLFVLLLDNVVMQTANFEHLCRVKWDLVIDMYMNSQDNGFIKNALSAKSIPSKIINILDRVSEDTFPLYNGEVPVIMANGLSMKAMSYNNARDWNRSYGSKLEKFLEQFFKVNTQQKVIVVSFMHNAEFVRSLFYSIDKFGRGLSFVIANDSDNKMASLHDDLADNIINSGLTPLEVNECISRYLPKRGENSEPATYILPGKDEYCVIKAIEMRSLEENFEVLYQGIEEGYQEKEEDFLRGLCSLTWEGAHRKFASVRNKHYQQYVAKVEKALMQGDRSLMLIHEPGFGGTTVARQIAYDLHDKFPTLVLKQYKGVSLKTQLEHIYDITSKSVLVIAEIPQVVSNDEFERLKDQLSSTRPILLLGVKRGTPSKDKAVNNLVVTDWGTDVCLLVDKFKPYLNRYPSQIQKEKENMLDKIVRESSEAYERTPFFIGLLTFDEDFYAIHSYLKKFVNAIQHNENQRKVLIYLSLCDVYGVKKALPEGFFASVFNEHDKIGSFSLETRFNRADGIVKSLLLLDGNAGQKKWQIRHPFFSQKLLPMLLNGTEAADNGRLMNLGSYCKQLISEIARSSYRKLLEETILQPLIIGTKADRAGENFTKLVTDMDAASQEDVFVKLCVDFPENPHFYSHLARYYSKNKAFDNAIKYADLALEISEEKDSMLYHIKAMCYYRKIKSIIDAFNGKKIKNKEVEQENLDLILQRLLPLASENFEYARCYQHDDEKEVTYLPNIYMLINVFDYAIDVRGLQKKKVLGEAITPYCRWIDDAQNLLDALKNAYVSDESEQYTLCEASMWESIKDFSEVISLLNSQIDKGQNISLVRRLLVRAYIKKNDKYKNENKTNSRLLSLMEKNILSDPNEVNNYMLWFNVARYSHMNMETVLEKMNQWKGLNPTKDVLFYCFVFYAIKAINNDSTAAGIAINLLDQCKHAPGVDSVYIKEWFVNDGLGIKKKAELRNGVEERRRVYGTISTYKHPGDARITLDCGLEVFFKPSVKGITEANLHHNVSCLIGFSYDGIRAWDESVKLEE